MLPPPLVIRTATPHPAPVLRELIPIEHPAPVPAVEVVDVDGGAHSATIFPMKLAHTVSQNAS
jgi:hypothetical protein